MVAAPQGYTNTPTIYQDRICREVLGGTAEDSMYGRSVLQWIDDSLLFAKDWDSFLKILDEFLGRCIK